MGCGNLRAACPLFAGERPLRTSHSRLVVRTLGFRCGPIRRPSQSIQARINKKPNMNIISLIIEAISGAVGGNVAGAAMKENSLGTAGNSIAGIVGGGLGGALLQS